LNIKENEMPQLGPTELIIILVIVVVLFGVGRIGKIAGELGGGIKAFKDGLQGNDDKDKKDEPKDINTEDGSKIN